MSEKTLMIIDSYALIYRAYYAFPPTLATPDGELVNAVFGFNSLMLDVINKFLPTNVIAVMDSGEPIERQTAFTQYKANRNPADEIMTQQLPRIEEVLQIFGIPTYKINGVEADDIIATIDNQFAQTFDKTIIVTGDQDIFQLVDDDTFVYLAGRRFSESKLFDASMVFEKLGIAPVQIPDYKSLAGDASDNIPGVKGVGPKTACDLISKYSTLEGIYENIAEVPGKVQTTLVENQEIAYLSKSLATVNKEIPLSIKIEDSEFENINVEKVREVFNRLQFKSLIPKLERLAKHYGTAHLSYSLFEGSDEPSEEKIVEVLKWDGNPINKDEALLLADFKSIEKDPLNWSFDKIYFQDGEKIYFVEQADVKDFFTKSSINRIVSFDTKRWMHSIINQSIETKVEFFDLGIAGVILSGGRSTYSINSVLNFFGMNYKDDYFSNIKYLDELYNNIKEQFTNEKKLEFLYDIEFKVLKVVIGMERNGIKADKEFFTKLEAELQKDKESLQQEIYKNAGHEFNIGSPKQVGEILFVEKSLPALKKTKGGSFSTDERSLRDLIGVDPIIENILKYRELDKILTTYVKALPLYINDSTKRIHSIFDQLGAISGRFASKNPNLQNIPKGEVLGTNIRDGFISEEDSYFISFDYSQQELRILAALSGEDVMIDSFNNEKDIHRITATEIFNITDDEVDSAKRDQGKTINFSIIYGISAFGLSDRMKIPREQATLFINRYFEKYTKVRGFMDAVLEEAKKNGYVETVLGRRRYSNTINSSNRNLRQAAEREMFNLVIQGTAADIMKLCMDSFAEITKKYSANLLLQIHDEFLFEVKTSDPKSEQVANFVKEIKEVMVNVYDLGVKYKVEASIGKRWGKMERI